MVQYLFLGNNHFHRMYDYQILKIINMIGIGKKKELQIFFK